MIDILEQDERDSELFLALEASLHRPDVRASADSVGYLLADAFVEFGSSGRVYDKEAITRALSGEEPEPGVTLPQVRAFRTHRLANDVVLVTYRSIWQVSANGQGPRETLRSSIYKHLDGRWQMVFHQGTLVNPGSGD